MTTQEAIDYYGGKMGLANALNIWPSAIYQWGDYPPRGKQFELQVKTNGQLIAEDAGESKNAGQSIRAV